MNSNSIGKKYPPETFKAIAENLLLLRSHRNISRQSAANSAMVSVSTLRKLERGDCSTVTIWRLQEVCLYYGIELHTVMIEGHFANPFNIPRR